MHVHHLLPVLKRVYSEIYIYIYTMYHELGTTLYGQISSALTTISKTTGFSSTQSKPSRVVLILRILHRCNLVAELRMRFCFRRPAVEQALTME